VLVAVSPPGSALFRHRVRIVDYGACVDRSRESPSSHLPLAMSVRPTRLALLVPTTGLDAWGLSWVHLFEAALAAQTRVWGGSGNLIFPLTTELADHALFWKLADLLDADAFVTYAPTWAEVREFAPAAYDTHMEKVRRQASGLDVEPSAVDDLLQDVDGHVAFNVQPTPEQRQLLNARLAPFHHGGDNERLHHFNAAQALAWPFTDASEFVQRPDAVLNPKAPGRVARQLLLTAIAGRIPVELGHVLRKRGVQVTDKPLRHSYNWARVVVDRPRPERATFPWAISDRGLGRYHDAPWQPPHAVVVVGDSPWDFALFYALKRMSGMAWWLPSWLRRNQVYLLELGSALEYEPRRDGRSVAIVSASSEAIRDRIARDIQQLTGRELTVTPLHWRDVLPEVPLRLYEQDNVGRTELVQLLGDETLDLRTPLPKGVGTEIPTEMRWLTEIQGRGWTPVRHRALGTALLRGMFTNTDLVRTTRDGVGYFSPGGVLIQAGASLDSVVARPTLRPLGVLEQVRTILEPHGWSCQPSDKGVYASESMNLFGGFEELCDALRDAAVRAVIDAYRDKRQGMPGRRLSIDARRYLTWDHFRQVLPDQPVATIIDPLLARGVLRRGLVLKCRRCRQEAWHAISAVGETFECNRCHLEQGADRFSWLGSDEPVWSYRMAEVLYQFLENDGELPVLAVHDVFEESGRPLAHAFELDLIAPDAKTHEVDIFSTDGYRLWIGEAKKNGRFESGRLAFVAHLASLTDAYGVLLTTSRSRWPPATCDQASAAFPGSWPSLRMVEGVRTGP
jgi:hypothetical protein